MRSIFGLRFGEVSRQISTAKLVMAIFEKRRQVVAAIFSLGCASAFALLISGCADAYYADANGYRAPEARYDTYYAPDYYPYYPWYSYYGGAYYYGD